MGPVPIIPGGLPVLPYAAVTFTPVLAGRITLISAIGAGIRVGGDRVM
jgi:hypothetical protein